MPLINTSLPNLIQGVSQQPDATRFSGQCDEQVNFMSSVVDGLTKRNGTRFVQRLGAADLTLSGDSFIHFINRSETERYVLLHNGTKLYAYNVLSGDEASIEVDGVVHTGGYTTAGTYLDVSASDETARDVLRATTVVDGTFVVNRNKIVGMDDTSRSSALDKEALIFVKQGDYVKEYSLDIEYNSSAILAAGVDLTYTKLSAGKPYGHLYRLSGASVQSAGTGYKNGDIYKILEYPTTHAGKKLLSGFLRGGGTDASLKVTTNSASGAGAISAVAIENLGPLLYFDKAETIGSSFTINVALETPSGEGINVSNNQTTASIRVHSEKSDRAISADTSRITEVIEKGTTIPNLHPGHSTPTPVGFADGTAFPGINSSTGNAEFSLVREGNLIILKRGSGKTDFNIKAKDGLGGGALGVVYKEVGAITDLPLFAKNGFRVKVRGDGELSADDYYVEFKTDDENQSIGPGSWVETVAPETIQNYDTDTLPLFITNTDLNKFKIQPLNAAPRIVGDDISNPFASFLAKKIQNSVFFKNRLGFVCGSNVILSEAGLGRVNDKGIFEYNFGRTTVTTLLDSDPIDIIVESDRVTDITAAAASQENLILFSTNGQFVLKGEDLLTPRTVSVKPITNFEYNNETDPVSVGSYIYYPFDLGNNTGIREFSLNKTTDVYESNEITEQVPRYIPKDITYFSGSLSENLLGVLSRDEDQTLYMYRYFFSENKKVLSSWFKWDFNMKIRGFEFIDSTLYLIAANPTTDIPSIVSLPLNFDGEDEGLATYTANGSSLTTAIATTPEDNVTHLDMRIPAIIYNDQVKFPTFTAGSTRPLRENISTFVVGGTSHSPYLATSDIKVYNDRGVNIPVTVTTSGGVTSLDVSTTGVWPNYTSVWVGYEFNSTYTFSEQIFKAQTGQARTPNAAATQFIKNLSLYHTKTSDYKIKVTPDKRNTYTNEFLESFTSSGGSLQILRTELKDGFFRAPVFTSSENVEIKLENDGAKPSNLQSAEFETFVHTRSSRYGA